VIFFGLFQLSARMVPREGPLAAFKAKFLQEIERFLSAFYASK
jgi:hypothetical protein